MDGIGLRASGFMRFETCSVLCAGHADATVPTEHSTDLGGLLGDYVAVTQTDGQPPMVSQLDTPSPQFDMSPRDARLLALHLLRAADIAERFAQPSPTAVAERELAVALAA